TRAAELLLLKLNGQWDSRLELLCNATFYCAATAGLGWMLATWLGRRSWPLIWVIFALDLALPFAWENTLWAFQNQFYFLIVFSLLTMGLLGLSRPLSRWWWLGTVAGIGAFFSMATGFVAAAVAGAMSLSRVCKGKEKWQPHLATWVVCGGLVLGGLYFRINVPGHEQAQSHSFVEFLRALGKGLAWPCVLWAWYAPVALAPVCVVVWRRLRSAETFRRPELFLFGTAGWVVLHALASAYARGIGGGPPAWRYMDYLSLLAVVNCLSLYLLHEEKQASRRFKMWLRAGTAIWTAGCITGLCYLTWQVQHRFLPEIALEQAVRQASARAFMATDDPGVFLNEPVTNRPVPNPEADVWIFRNPYLRPIFPVCFREPLHVAPATNSDDSFVPHGWLLSEADAPTERSWGSYSGKKEAARGIFESLPIQAGTLPYLVVPVAGDLGRPGLSLKLVEVNTGREISVTPSEIAHGEWLNVVVRAPSGPFKLVARDESETGWFAFKEPIEMGRFSLWTVRVLATWEALVIIGAGLFVLNLVRWRKQDRDA
ncbi:MAG TPA: hypothetical protein VFC07_16635, partial [Verrucomicrobiae bacterium]|nr:hypothetical protein [Verrucomicrobiae bacterium]